MDGPSVSEPANSPSRRLAPEGGERAECSAAAPGGAAPPIALKVGSYAFHERTVSHEKLDP